jgi:hypothetical protein
LIDEEALLFAKFRRNENKSGIPLFLELYLTEFADLFAVTLIAQSVKIELLNQPRIIVVLL